jgi:hypothetical protein
MGDECSTHRRNVKCLQNIGLNPHCHVSLVLNRDQLHSDQHVEHHCKAFTFINVCFCLKICCSLSYDLTFNPCFSVLTQAAMCVRWL